jgi:hypothetical protein
MKFSLTVSAIALAASLSLLAGQAVSETVKTDGVVCWTGDIERMGTSEKDNAWVFTIDWTYIPDDKKIENYSSGRCFGSGALAGGKPDVANTYCIHNRMADDAKFMSQNQASPSGSKATVFGGTGALAGVVGGWVGSAQISLPADDGKLAACRPLTGEYTTN